MNYYFDEIPTIHLPEKALCTVVSEIADHYFYNKKVHYAKSESENCITIGEFEKKPVKNFEYTINATDQGVYIEGQDYPAAIRGFITFLSKIRYDPDKERFYTAEFSLSESPDMGFRCVHICVFPETDLYSLKKYVRSCAFAKYSHIILEFWGMIRLDCMKELSWPFAYTKEQIKEIVNEANLLGVEIIPMFNHLGHAAACRESNGKHVVLDQNPAYEYLFQSHGWIWDFTNPKVRELLRKVRKELTELCGEGKYFHIGCDEAYALGTDQNQINEMVQYINEVSHELEKEGRRAIMWHDMLLSSEQYQGYVANSSDRISEILLNNINKNIIIADWQYRVNSDNWETSKLLKEYGFDVLCCPWDTQKNVDRAISTVKKNNLMGIIETTWHTMFKTAREMIYAGICSYKEEGIDKDIAYRFYCAEVMRKVMPSNGDYDKSGWSEKMVGPGL